jgi:hypothetical protein
MGFRRPRDDGRLLTGLKLAASHHGTVGERLTPKNNAERENYGPKEELRKNRKKAALRKKL